MFLVCTAHYRSVCDGTFKSHAIQNEKFNYPKSEKNAKHSRLSLAAPTFAELNDIKYLNYLKTKRLVRRALAPYENVSLICLTLIKLDSNLADKLRVQTRSCLNATHSCFALPHRSPSMISVSQALRCVNCDVRCGRIPWRTR